MAVSQQVIRSLSIEKLKGIELLDEIRFDDKPLTAIMGPNGCGKSTILHALACCYKPMPDTDQENWQFRDFFTPTTDATWAGSSLKMVYSYRDGATEYPNQIREYCKKADRWSPRYTSRPERYVRFIGIKSCVPRIEEETYTSKIKYQTEAQVDAQRIKNSMAMVFNRSYEELNIHRTHDGRKYPGLALYGTRYSALAMGAGEQRVLEILSTVFNAPKYSLILIDEIDLLLHTAALKKLIDILYGRAVEKSLQIIFTTHREAILELKNRVSVKHLHTVRREPRDKTYCFSNTTPDAVQRLTGQQEYPIEIFVEDGMALAIAEFELLRLGMKRIATITQYGAATNCFTLAAGLILSDGYDVNSQLFLLDGDVQVTQEEQRARVNAALSGTEVDIEKRRNSCLEGMRKFCPQGDIHPAPEVQLHKMIKSLPLQLDEGMNEIIDIAMNIEVVDNNHEFIKKIIETLNVEYSVGYKMVVDVASQSTSWEPYVTELRQWLIEKKPKFIENYGGEGRVAA